MKEGVGRGGGGGGLNDQYQTEDKVKTKQAKRKEAKKKTKKKTLQISVLNDLYRSSPSIVWVSSTPRSQCLQYPRVFFRIGKHPEAQVSPSPLLPVLSIPTTHSIAYVPPVPKRPPSHLPSLVYTQPPTRSDSDLRPLPSRTPLGPTRPPPPSLPSLNPMTLRRPLSFNTPNPNPFFQSPPIS